MPEIKSQENQQELFPVFSSSLEKPERLPGIQKTSRPILISTNLEQMLIAGILLILLACFVFFMGVLRGKAIAVELAAPPAASQAMPVTSRALMAPSRLVMTASAPVPGVKKTERVFTSETAPEPVLPPLAGQDLSKPYTIQLVTYKKKEFADQEVAALRHTGRYAWAVTSGDYFEVRVGQYLNKAAAKKDLKFFSSKYKGCFLRRR